MLSRRRMLQTAAGGTALAGLSGLTPAWARSADEGNLGIPALSGTKYDLTVGEFPVHINGRAGTAVGVNGTIPSPLIRFTEGEEITLNVTNTLKETTSIHWHGLLVPFHMDGVPGVSFPGIKPGETFQYKYSVPQNGTYWYHSHSGLQEPQGMYGPIIIDPKGADPVKYDREYVIVISDWTFVHPMKLFKKLKSMADGFNYQKRTVPDFMKDAKKNGFGTTMKQRAAWNKMRMSQTDISDVTGATYTYLINGRGTEDNWNGVFKPGERVRLRIINAASMSMFNVRIPGLPMTIVAADGLNVRPLEIDEFQLGVAETYDVIIEPKEAKAFAFVAESLDRAGQVVATFGPRPGMRATAPALRAKPLLTMADMGMDHSSMNMSGGDDMGGMDHSGMDMSGGDDMAGMDHSGMDMSGDMAGMDHSKMNMGKRKVIETKPKRGPGVVNVAAMPVSRLHEPGIGLANIGHRTLTYADLRSLEANTDTREPEREIVLHLTSNMERYMWSFNGEKFIYNSDPIKLYEGERVRMTMINNTMMPHPIHLHGMFFDLVNGSKNHKPRKHTVIVKPGEKLSWDINAEHVGDWAFHCHLFFHMLAGMFQVVSLLPKGTAGTRIDHSKMDHSMMKMDDMDMDMKTMDGMDHSKMDHSKMKMDKKPKPVKPVEMDHSTMDHSKMDHSKMNMKGAGK